MGDIEEDVLTEFRAAWCDMLEEIMECPVCLEVPKENIYQCVKGHSVCQQCKKLLEECPVCKSAFSVSRNFILEKIISKFAEIKLSLMEPENDINKVYKNMTKTISTQTTDGGGLAIARRSNRIADRTKVNKD